MHTAGVSYYVQSFKSKQRETFLDRATIIAELEAERNRLDSAIAALRGNRITFRKASVNPMAGNGHPRQQLGESSARPRRDVGPNGGRRKPPRDFTGRTSHCTTLVDSNVPILRNLFLAKVQRNQRLLSPPQIPDC
jgi:hypothetical protein